MIYHGTTISNHKQHAFLKTGFGSCNRKAKVLKLNDSVPERSDKGSRERWSSI